MSGIITGECVEVMAGMEPESVDAIVTDPPYGLEFMGKEWDRPWASGFSQTGYTDEGKRMLRPSFSSNRNPVCLTCHKHERGTDKCRCVTPAFDETARTSSLLMQDWHTAWATAALRVAKPGAYLLAFGGTRTVHRLTVALEDAGWIIRDLLCWVYASGFPKSKSSLKPAWEPIVLARKPGPLRELAIDACRIGTDGGGWNGLGDTHDPAQWRMNHPDGVQREPGGRWPANVLLTSPIFDGGWEGVVGGGVVSSGLGSTRGRSEHIYGNGEGFTDATLEPVGYGDTGTYSRFFLIPKASRADREPLVPGAAGAAGVGVLSGIGSRRCATCGEMTVGSEGIVCGHGTPERVPTVTTARRNTHPTVKPVELMRHLVRLVTPQGGTVLDPFLGSGSTAIAAEQEGFAWIGIEREAEYVAIAEQRLVDIQSGLGL